MLEGQRIRVAGPIPTYFFPRMLMIISSSEVVVEDERCDTHSQVLFSALPVILCAWPILSHFKSQFHAGSGQNAYLVKFKLLMPTQRVHSSN